MPETQTHKRKRSLQNTPVNISKMIKLTSSLNALREKLSGIDETEEKMAKLMKHVDELDHILGVKSLTFSNASRAELKNLNVKSGWLIFNFDKVAQLAQARTRKANFEDELKDLCSRLQAIYRRVNMKYDAGARIVLDAILLSLGEITSALSPNRDLAIIPEMKLEDALFTNKGYQVVFSGSIDYGIMEYEKDENDDNYGRLVRSTSIDESIFQLAAGHFFLTQAKRHRTSAELVDSIPEAVTQAMTVSSNANLDTVHFCLSDGTHFIFFVLKKENGIFTYYESTARRLYLGDVAFDNQLQVIINLLLEWLKPTQTDLYRLKL